MDRAPDTLTAPAPRPASSSAMLHVLDRLDDARADCARWPAFLEELAVATGATRAGLFALSGRNHGEIWIPWRLSQSVFDQWHGYFRNLDPWQAATRLPARSEYCVVAGERLVSDERLQATEYFDRFLKPNDLRWLRAAWLRPDAAHAATYGVVLFRGLSDTPFDPAVEGMLDRIMRHLHIDERHAVANAMSRATGLEGDNKAVFLLNASGGLVMCDDKADELLTGGAVTAGASCLGFSNPAVVFWLDALTRHGGFDAAGGVARLRERLPGSGVSDFELRPFRPIDQSLALYGVRYALTVSCGALPAVINASRAAQQMYQWTSSELDTVRRLAAGDDLPAIADARGCAVETVRSHLKNAKRKAHVKRQVDLVRMMIALESPAPRTTTTPASSRIPASSQ